MVERKLSKIYDNFASTLLSQKDISRYDRALVIKYYGDILLGSIFFLSILCNPGIIRSFDAFFKFCSIFAFISGILELGVEFLQAKCFGLCSPKPIHVFVHPLKNKRRSSTLNEPYKLEFMNPKLADGFHVLYNFD